MPSRQGIRLYLISSGVAQVCALARYVLLARLLGPAQLGLAATLILTAQFFDAVTNNGGDHFLIQNRDGDRPEVQRLVHLTTIGRGILTALGLIVCAVPIARFFDQADLAGAIMVLAIVPLLLGFLHLDLRRAQRHNDFRREAWATLLGESAGFIATAAAAWMIRDYTAILYGLIARALTMLLVSHLTAERRYAIGVSRDHVRTLAAFSLPLMLNGVVLFAGSQGDRVLIGDALGAPALGHYSAILLLVMYPSAMLQRVFAGAYLPRLSTNGGTPAQRASTADLFAGETLLLALAMAAGFAIVAPTAIVLLYGARFGQGALTVAAIGLLQAARFIRLWPGTEALALGRSRIPLAGNLIRVIGLPLALVVFHRMEGDLRAVVAAFVLGEVVSLFVTVILTNRAAGRPWRHSLMRPVLFAAGAVVIAAGGAAAESHRWAALAAILVAGIALAAVIVLRERAVIDDALALVRGVLARKRRA